MAKTIEIVKVSTTGDTIRYELWDNTGPVSYTHLTLPTKLEV